MWKLGDIAGNGEEGLQFPLGDTKFARCSDKVRRRQKPESSAPRERK